MKPELIIFDMDGLMFDTERIYYQAWEEALTFYGYDFGWEVYIQLVARNSHTIGLTLKKIYGESFPYEAVRDKKRAISDEIIAEQGMPKKPGLMELLDFLEEEGIKKAVATSSTREKALNYLELGGVRRRFDHIVCGSDVKESKPHPEIFEIAAKRLQISPQQTIVLEDSKMGVKAAKAAGMYGIFIPDLVEMDEEIQKDASMTLKNLYEVMEWIKKG